MNDTLDNFDDEEGYMGEESKRNILFYTCGVCGSGKTEFTNFFAKRNGIVRLSSDQVRSKITGAERDMSKEEQVWGYIQGRVEYVLDSGKDLMFDSTNLIKKNRRFILGAASLRCIKVVCFYMKTDLDLCKKRSANRVSESVIDKQNSGIELPQIPEDGNIIVNVAGSNFTKEDALIQVISEKESFIDEMKYDELFNKLTDMLT